MQALEGPGVDLAGHRDLALVLEAPDRLDGGGVVGPGDVAEQPGDGDQPGLEVADLGAGVAARQQGGAGVEDVEQLVVGRLLRHRAEATPGPLVDDAGGLQSALGLEAGDALAGRAVVDAGGQLGEPRELEEPGLELAHRAPAVALLEAELRLERRCRGLGLLRGRRRRTGRPARPRRWAREPRSSSLLWCSRAYPAPYAVAHSRAEVSSVIISTRRARITPPRRSGRTSSVSAKTPDPWIWLLSRAVVTNSLPMSPASCEPP